MKKSILFGTFILLAFTSCRKTWTCECTSLYNGGQSISKTTIHKETKKNATTECSNYEFNYKQQSGTNAIFSCQIK
jgi:hypothetical protein